MQIHKRKKMKDKRMYKIILEDGSDLLVSEKHEIYSKIVEKDLALFSVYPIVMVKILKNDNISLKPERQDKTTNLNSLELAQVMPEVFEVCNANGIRIDDLLHLLSESDCKVPVLSFELIYNSLQIWRNLKLEAHFSPINLSSLSSVIGMCGPFDIRFSFLTYSSLNGSSSTGYQSMLSQNSWSFSDNVPVLMNLSNISFFTYSSRATSDQLIQENFFNSSLIDSGIVNVAVAIYNAPRFFNSSNFLSSCNLLNMPALSTSFQFTSGNSFFACSNSFGNDTVNVAILAPPLISVNTMKSVGIYKDIDSGGDGFKLISVTEAYSLVKEGKELYFLNSENNEIKIKTIEKERYYGKIYDVDVENDVVLIKRNNLVVCSGNGVEHNFTSLADERCMILGEKMNKIEEVNKK